LAVADAVTHHRQIQELTVEELSQRLAGLGHDLPPAALRDLEERRRAATVGELVALAYALRTTPAVLLSHIPIDLPHPEGPIATALPADVEQPELRAWLEGRTTLDGASRLQWAKERVHRLTILAAHHEEQLQGALAELHDLGDLALQEADAVPVQRLHDRIRESSRDVAQADLAL